MTLCIASFFWIDPARAKVRGVPTTPEDVRIWDRMVARHLTIPHRRVCITHRPDLIDFMETVPLDLAKHVPGTCTVKLMAWRPDIGEVLKATHIVTMDVDAVVTASLDELFQPARDIMVLLLFYFFERFLQVVDVNWFEQVIDGRKFKRLNRVFSVSRCKNDFKVNRVNFRKQVKSCFSLHLNVQENNVWLVFSDRINSLSNILTKRKNFNILAEIL